MYIYLLPEDTFTSDRTSKRNERKKCPFFCFSTSFAVLDNKQQDSFVFVQTLNVNTVKMCIQPYYWIPFILSKNEVHPFSCRFSINLPYFVSWLFVALFLCFFYPFFVQFFLCLTAGAEWTISRKMCLEFYCKLCVKSLKSFSLNWLLAKTIFCDLKFFFSAAAPNDIILCQ